MLEAWNLPLEYGEYLTSMVMLDGDEHARLRAKVIRTFSARRINALRPTVEQVADQLLHELEGRNGIDLMADFAYPLANAAICHLIGVDKADQENGSCSTFPAVNPRRSSPVSRASSATGRV
ncbi:hypothetical protein ACFWF7_08610 [Nocardia sp. NPDC060256]|uniref:hypothetical protein n=1 Tax=unclassified Nocardia TaxID=2637762 RepID=UPI00364C34C2